MSLTIEQRGTTALVGLSVQQFGLGAIYSFAGPTASVLGLTRDVSSSNTSTDWALAAATPFVDWDLFLPAQPSRKYASTGVVWWFNLGSIERYESDHEFAERLRAASAKSRYARRLLFLLEEPADEFAPVAIQAARRAWDVLSQLPSDAQTVKVFPGAEGGLDLQLRAQGVVRLRTAGSEGIFESRQLDRATGVVDRHVRFGPTVALKFLLTGANK